MGVEEENGFTLNYDKYNWEEHPDHFILQDADRPIDFGEGKRNIYALEGTEVLVQRNKEVQMAAHDFGKGRAVYISGVPYSFANSRKMCIRDRHRTFHAGVQDHRTGCRSGQCGQRLHPAPDL